MPLMPLAMIVRCRFRCILMLMPLRCFAYAATLSDYADYIDALFIAIDDAFATMPLSIRR